MRHSLRERLRGLYARIRDQRGSVLVVVATGMLALTSVVALSIDVGLLTTARLEAQRAADAAALAGAGAFIGSPGNKVLAEQLATDFAARNDVRFDAVAVTEGDIEIDTDALTVKVTVHRNRERGNAIPTFFARVFGVNDVNIAATATAEAAPAGGINCLLPVAIPDRWYEAGGPGNDPNDYNPEHGDYYKPWIAPESDPPVYNDDFTGYAEKDLGMQIPLKSNTAGGGLNPSWYYPWRPPSQSGADDYRTNVNSCVDPSILFYVGINVETEPGNMVGPTMQGFGDLIDQDPTARWNTTMQCVVSDGYQASHDPTKCRQSPRIRPVPLFNPTEEPDLGAKPFEFTNFAGIFVEDIQGQTVYGRWLGYTGVKPASPDEATTAGPLFKVLRLID
jgi:Flp pilus assembly protein TadG